MPSTTLHQYRDLCRDSGIFFETEVQVPPVTGAYCAYRVEPAVGKGWMDMLQVGADMTLGRAAYALNVPFRQQWQKALDPLGIFVLLSGPVSFTTRTRAETLDSGSVWVRDGRQFPGDILYELPARQSLVGVSVDVPPRWLDAQVEVRGGPGGAAGRVDFGRRGLFQRLGGTGVRRCLAAAETLLVLRPDSVVSRLRLESAALDLVAALLDLPPDQAGPPLPRRHRAAVDDAVTILREELEADHPIASLARRVGLNECSLKAAFRRVTGTTIAAFLRDRRMHHARSLIEREGQSVQQAALAVGYANPSHFAAAFRKVHGRSPSALR
jgi:AraC-like DNA-binding protein